MSSFWARAGDLLQELVAATPLPPLWLLAVAFLISLGLVLYKPAYRIVRHGDTILHEGGHAFVAFLMGGKGMRIQLNRDSSGLATWRDPHVSWWRRAAVSFAGYSAGCTLGFLGILAIMLGHSSLVLLGLLLALLLILIHVRTWWGLLIVPAVAAGLALLIWYLPPTYLAALAVLLVIEMLTVSFYGAIEQFNIMRRSRGMTEGGDWLHLAAILHLPVPIASGLFVIWDAILVAASAYVVWLTLLA
jgi:hypothetical protein